MLTVDEWQRMLEGTGRGLLMPRMKSTEPLNSRVACLRSTQCATAPSTSCGRTFLSTARSTARWRRSNRTPLPSNSSGAGGAGIVWAVIDSGIDGGPSPLQREEAAIR